MSIPFLPTFSPEIITNKVKKTTEELILENIKEQVVVYLEKIYKEEELKRFLKLLSFEESRHNWKIINRFGYMGKYQFHYKTLIFLGYKGITPRQFKKNPEIFNESLQEQAIRRLLYSNTLELKKEIEIFSNKYYKGVYITKSGLLAAAHLLGAATIKDWLYETTITKIAKRGFIDGNKTHITVYITKFAFFNF